MADAKIVRVPASGVAGTSEIDDNLDGSVLIESADGKDYIEIDTTDSAEKLILAAGGAKTGIGASPEFCDAKGLEIKTGDSGVLAEDMPDDPTFANLVIEGSDHTGITILTPTNKQGGMIFVDANSNDQGTPDGFIYDQGASALKLQNGNAERLRVQGDGNIRLSTGVKLATGNEGSPLCAANGIHIKEDDTNITSPNTHADLLVIEANTHPGISLLSNNTSRNTIAFGDPQNSMAGELRYTHGGGSNADMFFLIMQNSVAINVDHDHKLGVNHECVDASGQLQVNCPDGANVPCVVVDQNDSTNNPVALEIQNAGSGDGIKYAGPSSKFFHVKSDGDCENTNNSYGAISDRRLKENITDATPKLDDLNKLHVCNFNFKGDDLKQIGLIADEVAEVFPALVKSSDTRTYASTEIIGDSGETQIEKSLIGGFEDQKSVKYSVLVPMLVKCIQELNAKIDKIEEALENGN